MVPDGRQHRFAVNNKLQRHAKVDLNLSSRMVSLKSMTLWSTPIVAEADKWLCCGRPRHSVIGETNDPMCDIS